MGGLKGAAVVNRLYCISVLSLEVLLFGIDKQTLPCDVTRFPLSCLQQKSSLQILTLPNRTASTLWRTSWWCTTRRSIPTMPRHSNTSCSKVTPSTSSIIPLAHWLCHNNLEVYSDFHNFWLFIFIFIVRECSQNTYPVQSYSIVSRSSSPSPY